MLCSDFANATSPLVEKLSTENWTIHHHLDVFPCDLLMAIDCPCSHPANQFRDNFFRAAHPHHQVATCVPQLIPQTTDALQCELGTVRACLVEP